MGLVRYCVIALQIMQERKTSSWRAPRRKNNTKMPICSANNAKRRDRPAGNVLPPRRASSGYSCSKASMGVGRETMYFLDVKSKEMNNQNLFTFSFGSRSPFLIHLLFHILSITPVCCHCISQCIHITVPPVLLESPTIGHP